MKGRKNSPCRPMASTVAGRVRPMVWSIMLLMVTKPTVGKDSHWSRRAVVPYSTTTGSSRKRAMSWEEKQAPATAMTTRHTVDTFTQNQKARRTRP